MPSDYTSFRIQNTTDIPILLSVTDAEGNMQRVGRLKPGKASIQVAPAGASWSIQRSGQDPGEHIVSPVPGSLITILPDHFRIEPLNEPASSLLADSTNTKPIPYEAFLKLETGSHSARINQLLVTPDGKSLITSGADKTIRIWDVESRKQTGLLLGQIGDGDEGKIQAIRLSKDRKKDGKIDSKYLVALAWMNPGEIHEARERETDVRVYELATGNLQAYLRYPGELQDLDFSPDGKYLVMVGNPKDSVRQGYVLVYRADDILNAAGRAPASIASKALYDDDALIPAYVRCIPDNQEESAGYRIVVATWYKAAKTAGLLWYSFTSTGDTGKLQNTAQCDLPVLPESLAVSREFAVITGDTGSVENMERKRTIYCYDHHGNLCTRVVSDSRPVKPVFSQNGSQLIVGQSNDGTLIQIKAQGSTQVKVYDIALGQFLLKSTYYGHDSEVLAVGFLPNGTSPDTADGTAVSAGGDQNEIHFWNTAHLEGERTGVIKGMGRVVHAVGIKESENEIEQIGFGTRNYLRMPDGSIVLQRAFDVRSKMLRSLSYEESQAFRRAKTQLGELSLEWREVETNPNLWLLYSSGAEEPLTGTWNKRLQWYKPLTFGFTDNLTIVTGDTEGNVRVAPQHADQTYALLPWRVLVGHTARVLDHATCGKWLVTAGADQVIRLWYLEDAEQDVMTDLEPALNLFVGSDDEWVLWSKSGYYTASQNGGRYIGYHINRGPDKEALFFSSDRFQSVFLRPDIIKAILVHGSEERVSETEPQISIPSIDVGKILPPIIELDEAGVQQFDEGKQGFVSFTLTAESHGKSITHLHVLRNGRLVYEEETIPSSGKIPLSKIRLLPGKNRFKIFAEIQADQSHAIKSNPIEKEIDAKKLYENEAILENGILYILAVGVSEGTNLKKRKLKPGDTLELTYAHEDAIAIYNAFAQDNKAFERIEALPPLVNTEATRDGIRTALENLTQKIREKVDDRAIRGETAKRDVLLVFLSGHGVYRRPNQQLYFWNYEYDPECPDETGLSFMELGEKITSLPADVVLMTDACHSGMAGSDVLKGFDPDTDGIDPNELAARIYGINESDMYIFNAARRSESSVEDSSIQHGYFTRSILDALGDIKNTELTMLGLIDQVQWRVQGYMKERKEKDLKNVVHNPVCRIYGDLLPLQIYKR